jgi:hypothetical protein
VEQWEEQGMKITLLKKNNSTQNSAETKQLSTQFLTSTKQ